jgi:hypothetical protein
MNAVYIGIAAFLGGIFVSLLGWTETQEAFNGRKFASSAIRSFIGAVVIAAGVNYAGEITPVMYALAFLGGAGVDAGGKRIAGAIASRGQRAGQAKS